MAPIIAAIASMFAKEGMSLLAGAVKGGGEKAVKFIEDKTGIDIKDVADQSSPRQITPEQVAALKTLESTERIELARMGYADVASARSREVDITKATGSTNWPIYIIAVIVIVGFFVLMYELLSASIPTSNEKALYMMFGYLGGAFTGVVQYFFGSSKGSADKTALIKGK